MWMVTPLGNFNIRCSPEDAAKGTLTIEAKTRSDLEALVNAVLPAACPIVEMLARGFMTRCGRGEVALALATLALDLDYDNVADEFIEQQGDGRGAVAAPLWQVLSGH